MNIEIIAATEDISHLVIEFQGDITSKYFQFTGEHDTQVTVWVDDENRPLRVDIYG